MFYSQVRMWDNYIYNELNKRKISNTPQKRSNLKIQNTQEHMSKNQKWDSMTGLFLFDLNSLYPHLIMQYNISPETLAETRHPSASVEGILNQEVIIEKEFATCANGAQYTKKSMGSYQR